MPPQAEQIGNELKDTEINFLKYLVCTYILLNSLCMSSVLNLFLEFTLGKFRVIGSGCKSLLSSGNCGEVVDLELQMPHVPSSAAKNLRRERENTETLELVPEGREFGASGCFFGNIWRGHWQSRGEMLHVVTCSGRQELKW